MKDTTKRLFIEINYKASLKNNLKIDRMMSKLKTGLPALVILLAISSCKKDIDSGILNTGNFPADETPLKSASDFPIGVAVNYNPLINETKFAEIVKRDFNQAVFGYEMKHGAIVQSNGSLNFTNADAMVTALGNMSIFGHTLGWHQNQNATYVKNFAGITIPAATENLSNPGFETGNTNWSVFNTNGATVTFVTGDVPNAHAGGGYMRVVNPTANPGNQWKVQVASQLIPTTINKQYTFTYYVKAASSGGSIRLSSQDQAGGNAQYQGDQAISTAWSQISWTITANSAQTRVLFDMGLAANTYSIDDASFKEVIQAPSGAQVAAKVDQALNDFITGTVGHFKNTVKAWDVVNEAVSPSGAFRTTANSSDIPNKGADYFMWSDYLGRDYPLKAFTYAKAADPTADLYINDFGLESSSVKTDSLIALVNELKTKGAKIDGIGTQMHVTVNTSYAGIDAAFKKLAATGLKIRVSELDVRINPLNKPEYQTLKVPATLLATQADMYQYIVSSYLKYIPAAQRAGITIWGVNDKNSWLYNNGREYPLLFDNDYNRKPAYSGVLQGLKAK
jgi:endo-1,4-beta-xylanase